MKKQTRKKRRIALGILGSFVLWTAAVSMLDVQPIGPGGSAVGLATLNGVVHNFTGVNWSLYIITDWLGLIPMFFVLGFALLGLAQWIRRKSVLRVDYSILVLGGFYILVMAAYVFFELFVVNYRPVLINGFLEASYPSSTTLLVLTVMPTAMMQLNARITNAVLKRCAAVVVGGFVVFMVVGRLFSGVHWIADIIGGALLSGGLDMLYDLVQGYERK